MAVEDLTGKVLGPYQIVAPLGEGGMAAVYKAYQPNMDRYVAVKVLPRHFAKDPQFVQRFEREAKIIANLQHPHIVSVFDYGEAEGYTFMVMPFLESGTLAEKLRGRPLPPAMIRQVISQVGDALDYAHAQGVVHRDVKPSNILIDQRGNCLLTDFGIGKILAGTAKLTGTGDVIGTPAYMSPEQGLGQTPDGRSDIYSLGVMLYEMATGRPPFDAETPFAIVIKHIHDPLPPPHTVNPQVSAELERVILKALAKDRVDRYATAGQMVCALQMALDQTAVPVSPPAPTQVAGSQAATLVEQPAPATVPQHRTKKAIWMAAAGLGLVIFIGMVLGVWWVASRMSSRDEAEPTTTPDQAAVVTSPQPTESPTSQPNPIIPPVPTAMPADQPTRSPDIFDARGLEVISLAEDWEGEPLIVESIQAEVVDDPQGLLDRVGRLFVRGYGHGEQTASITLPLNVPAGADIVYIPVATSLNGTVDETDSEAGLEISVWPAQSDPVVWTYASHLLDTEFGIPYIWAFADVSSFREQEVMLTITLRQPDVCAGSQCTHDIDAYLGDLIYARLPDICTTESDGRHMLYDYYDDPTPTLVADCADPQAFYFLDVADGPFNAYGPGRNQYQIPIELPAGAELVEFRLYYGYFAEGLTINEQQLTAEEVYAAFPQRSGTYLNTPKPSRHSLVNNNPAAVASFFRPGANTLTITVYAEQEWEERPFDFFARFRVPTP